MSKIPAKKQTKKKVDPFLAEREDSRDLTYPPESYQLSVRDTNNLVRFLYGNGWISHEEHPEVIEMLDQMIAWLERQGIHTSMVMPKL